MTAFVIYQAEILDPERYEDYKAAALPTVLDAGGRYVVRGGPLEVLEGEAPAGRTVVLEFPTMHAAIDWYGSEAYTAARRLREGVAQARMYVVEYLDG